MAKLENLEQELQEARREYHGKNSQDFSEEDIIAAAHVGNLALVEHLIENGADVNMKDDDGHTALMEAVIWEHHSIIDILLQNGAKVNDRDGFNPEQAATGCTAILHADDEKAIDILLKYGANIDDIGLMYGNGLLHKAVEQSDLNRIKFLLSRNASIDLEMQNGMTPLMIAVKKRDLEIVKLLVGNNADVNHRDKIGVSVLQLAKLSGNKEVEKYLTSNGAYDNKPRSEALDICQPDYYSVHNYFMAAIKTISSSDGTLHVLFYGTGFTSIWFHLSACRRMYFCIKDGRMLYYFAGDTHEWFHFVEYDKEGHGKLLRLNDISKDLYKNFPNYRKKLKGNAADPPVKFKFKPIDIQGIDINSEFASLKEFFNEYIEILEVEKEIPESNFSLYYCVPIFTKKGEDFCGEVIYCESSNYPDEIMEIIDPVIGEYYRT